MFKTKLSRKDSRNYDYKQCMHYFIYAVMLGLVSRNIGKSIVAAPVWIEVKSEIYFNIFRSSLYAMYNKYDACGFLIVANLNL